MPKKYMHTKRGKTLNYEIDALEAVKVDGMSIREAAATFSVPRATLGDRISGKYGLIVKHGRPPALPEDVEKTIVSSIKMASKLGVGLSRKQIIRRTHVLCNRLKISSGYANFKAGKDWFDGLRRRYPELVMRKPEKLSSIRARMMNPEVANNYFGTLKDIITQSGLENYTERIWNCDETGFNFEHSPINIVAEKGDRCVLSRTSAKSSNVTVMACVNAIGARMPPMIITKGKTNRALQGFNVSDAPENTVWSFQKNGWIDDEIGEKWFDQVFSKYCGPDRPQLLILDGHGSHETMAIIERAISENIILLSLPPHCTHILQPLDRTVFGPLKAAYNEQCSDFLVEHPLHVVNKWSFPCLFNKAWDIAVSPDNIKNGFRACGIAPFNPGAIPASACAPSKPTDVQIREQTSPKLQPLIEDSMSSAEETYTASPVSLTVASDDGTQTSEAVAQTVLDISDPQQLLELISSGDFLVEDISLADTFVGDFTQSQPGSSSQSAVVSTPDTLETCTASLFLPPN